MASERHDVNSYARGLLHGLGFALLWAIGMVVFYWGMK